MSKRKAHYGGKHIGGGRSQVELPYKKRSPYLRKIEPKKSEPLKPARRRPKWAGVVLAVISGLAIGTGVAVFYREIAAFFVAFLDEWRVF